MRVSRQPLTPLIVPIINQRPDVPLDRRASNSRVVYRRTDAWNLQRTEEHDVQQAPPDGYSYRQGLSDLCLHAEAD